MSNERGDQWIVYNGEMYNFQEIQKEIGSRAGPFRSRTDTEVLLKAIEVWGIDALNRFRGMFAFALLDQRTQQLILARDPLGIKPLYYYQGPDFFVFGSEVRCLLASGLVPRKLSVGGVGSFLRNGAVQAPATILDGVISLLPSHSGAICLNARELSVISTPFATGLFGPSETVFKSRREASRRLLDLLTESVRLHLISDVPLGVFLSGGLDSSALVALTKQVTRTRPKTFAVVFSEQEFSESAPARLVADTFGTDHHEVHLSERRMLELLPTGLRAMDQPTVDGLNTFVVSKAVKEEGVTVALSGLGGDELFAGYPTFRRAAALSRIGMIPTAIRRRVAIAGKACWNGTVPRTKFWRLMGSEPTAWAAYRISRDLFSTSECQQLLDGNYVDLEVEARDETSDVVNAMSNYEMRGFMANTLLRDADFMSMAHALEVRVPFLDVDVVRYVLSLPGSWKMGGPVPKPLLVEALDGLLPASVWRRKKMGFALPFARWMLTDLKRDVEEQIFAAGSMSAAGVEPRSASMVWRRFLRHPGSERWARPWSLFVLGRWCNQHGARI